MSTPEPADPPRWDGDKMVWTHNGVIAFDPASDPDGAFPEGTTFDEMQQTER